MNTRLLHSVLTHAAALADGAADDDAGLLRRVAASRDPAAFAALVGRYGRLVWAVCGAALGPWLHTVARRVAGKAARADARRRARERSAAAPDRDAAVPPTAWDAVAAAVHDEVDKLPDRLRVPFVLCCLEGRGAAEAAAHLGWKPGTFSGRLTRAKQALIDRLAKRGLPATAVAGTLTAAVPAAATAKAVDLISAGHAVPSPVLELAKGATTMTKTKLLAAAVLVAAGLAASVGGWLATADAQTPEVAKDVKKLADAIGQAVNKKPDAKWEYVYHAMLFDRTGRPTGPKAADFEKLLDAMEGEGWAYLGQADIVGLQGASLPSLVFRRPRLVKAGGDPAAPPVQRLQPAAVAAEDPEVVETRYLITLRMRKDPAETFAAALAAVIADDPGRPAAVAKYGRAKLEAEVATEVAKWRLNSSPDEVAAVLQDIRTVRAGGDRKTVTFKAADFGLSVDQLHGVMLRAVERKYPGADRPIAVTPAPEKGLVDAAGSGPAVDWLVHVMAGVKAKPNR